MVSFRPSPGTEDLVGHSVPGMGARPGQGRRHEILIGGGGRIHMHPNPPTRKIYSLLGFPPLYFENVGKCKKCYKFKKILKYPNFWEVDPRSFQKCGGHDPREPPSATPLAPAPTPLIRT